MSMAQFKRHENGWQWVERARRGRSGAVGGRGRPRIEGAKTRRPEYKIWCGMISRCRSTKCVYHGGRGIRVCDRWSKFENFDADMGPRPSPNHSLDRIDPNGHYSPENCRWATPKQQASNKRGARRFWFKGKSRTVRELSEAIGVTPWTIYIWISGLSQSDAESEILRRATIRSAA